MKGPQMQFDGFMLHIMRKQSTSQEGKMQPRNKAARAIGLTSMERGVNTDVLVSWCGRFVLFGPIFKNSPDKELFGKRVVTI